MSPIINMKIISAVSRLLVKRIAQMLAVSESEVISKYGTNEARLSKLCDKLTKNLVKSSDSNNVFTETDDFDPGEAAVANIPTLTEAEKAKAKETIDEKITKVIAGHMAASKEKQELGDHSVNTSDTALPPIPPDKLKFE